MMRRLPLPKARRRAFAALIKGARKAAGYTFQDAADAACVVLGDPDGPSWRYVQHLETGPPSPLANPVWLGALLESLGLGWYEVLQTLGIGDSVYPNNCPQHPDADGPLVGHRRAPGGGFEYRVHCTLCLEPGPPAVSRDAAIEAWNRALEGVRCARP